MFLSELVLPKKNKTKAERWEKKMRLLFTYTYNSYMCMYMTCSSSHKKTMLTSNSIITKYLYKPSILDTGDQSELSYLLFLCILRPKCEVLITSLKKYTSTISLLPRTDCAR